MNSLITLIAHGGHPWITGAAEPTASLDHFLAALFFAVLVGVGLASLSGRGGVAPASRRPRSP